MFMVIVWEIFFQDKNYYNNSIWLYLTSKMGGVVEISKNVILDFRSEEYKTIR